MASSASLIKYDHTPGKTFFFCRKCQTHIVRKEAHVFTYPGSRVGLFENEVVNVKVAEEKKFNVTSCTFVEVFCLGCQTLLGQQMIAVENEDFYAQKGRFCMLLNMLIQSEDSAAVDEEKDNQEPDNESKNSAAVDE